MKKKLVIIFSLIFLFFTTLVWMNPIKDSSDDERRKLAQFPELDIKSVTSGTFMDDFEDYAKDQFLSRYSVRKMKALFRYYGLGIYENNDIILDKGKAIKLEYPLKENEIIKAANKFNDIYTKYLSEDNNVYISIIPNKSYYSNKNIPKIDFLDVEEIMNEHLQFGTYISIKDKLSLDDFYNTDIHWKQESLNDVAITLLSKMNQSLNISFTINETNIDFNGVYKGHSALPLKSDTINYITNKSIRESTVRLIDDEGEYPLYNMDGLKSIDQYDFYLYGPQPIVEINNPNALEDNELIIFRDSYMSSLAPYFVDHYSKITLIDIRYIHSDILSDYVDFKDSDVLFMYNTSILNSSSMLK